MVKIKKQFIYQAFNYLRIIDGDTLNGDIDLGMGICQTDLDMRVYGIDTPEMKTIAGRKAAVLLYGLMRKFPFYLESVEKPEKYGRLTVDIYFEAPFWPYGGAAVGDPWTTIACNENIARIYHGDKKIEWTANELERAEKGADKLIDFYELQNVLPVKDVSMYTVTQLRSALTVVKAI